MDLSVLSEWFLVAFFTFLATVVGLGKLYQGKLAAALESGRRRVAMLEQGQALQTSAYQDRGEKLREAQEEVADLMAQLDAANAWCENREAEIERLTDLMDSKPSIREQTVEMVGGILEGLLEVRQDLLGLFDGDAAQGGATALEEWPEGADFALGEDVRIIDTDDLGPLEKQIFAGEPVGVVTDIRLSEDGWYEYAVQLKAGRCSDVVKLLQEQGIIPPGAEGMVQGVGAWLPVFALERVQDAANDELPPVKPGVASPA